MEPSAAKGRAQGRLLVSTSLDAKDELEEVHTAFTPTLHITHTTLLSVLLCHSLCYSSHGGEDFPLCVYRYKYTCAPCWTDVLHPCTLHMSLLTRDNKPPQQLELAVEHLFCNFLETSGCVCMCVCGGT